MARARIHGDGDERDGFADEMQKRRMSEEI